MTELYKKKCIACDGDRPPFDISEIHKYLKKIDGWDVKSNEDKNYYLVKEFKFNNFILSKKFVDSVSNLAEEEGHHPDIFFFCCFVNKTIFNHLIKGLADSDFILAAKIDKI